jgi:hypothetical protein
MTASSVQIENPQGLTDPEDCTRNLSSPIPQPTRESRSWEPTRGSPFCCGKRSRTICRVLDMTRSSTYCREYVSGRFHACGLASDPISFASRRRDPLAGSRSWQVFWLMVHSTPRAFPSTEADSGIHGFRPHLQRRDREGLTPSSLTQESQCGGHFRRQGRILSSSLMSVNPCPAQILTDTAP